MPTLESKIRELRRLERELARKQVWIAEREARLEKSDPYIKAITRTEVAQIQREADALAQYYGDTPERQQQRQRALVGPRKR
jgi:hypothetical protein